MHAIPFRLVQIPVQACGLFETIILPGGLQLTHAVLRNLGYNIIPFLSWFPSQTVLSGLIVDDATLLCTIRTKQVLIHVANIIYAKQS